MSTSNYFNPYAPATAMCEYCGVRPKYGNYSYCGKTCATEGSKWKPPSTSASTSTALPNNYQYAPPPPPPNYTQGQSEIAYYGTTYVKFVRGEFPLVKWLCSKTPMLACFPQNCGKRGKSWESKEDGSIVQHRYCGILCHEASQSTTPPASIIPAPAPVAAASRADAITLREEGSNAPIGRKILLMMQERWDSNNVSMTKLKSIYRVDLPGKIYRRFDFALQANDGCTVVTTYYGGKAACDIANDSNPAPCNLESCAICDALRTAFSQLIYGASSVDGVHGPGLYTYTNPASAHQSEGPTSSRHRSDTNFVLIQCRVVTRGNAAEVSNPYAGFVDDSGVVFCSQPMAIIPTHLLVYRARSTVLGAPPARAAENTFGPPVALTTNPPNRNRARRVSPPPAPLAPSRVLPRAPASPTRPLMLPSLIGDRSKFGRRDMYSAVPQPKRRRPGVTFDIDGPGSSTQQADLDGKKESAQDDTPVTSSPAPPTSSVDAVTVEPPRGSPALPSPKPTRRVVLDPVYIPLPPSPSPDDPPAKKVKKVAKPETKQGPSRDEDDAVQPPRPVETQDGLPSTSKAVEEAPHFRRVLNGPSIPELYLHCPLAGVVHAILVGLIYLKVVMKTDSYRRRKPPFLPDLSPRASTTAQTLHPSRMCNYCHVIPKFGGFDYCSKTCASKVEGARQALSPSRVLPAWDTIVKTSEATPSWGNSTPAYPTRRESTPPSDSSSAFATAVPSRQRAPAPLWSPWNLPDNDQEKADTPPARESRAYPDFVIPPRAATPQRISETSWFGGESEPNTGEYIVQYSATFGIKKLITCPATSGTPDNSAPTGLAPILSDERVNTFAPYVPSTSYSLPTPVIAPTILGGEEPVEEDDGLSLTSPVHRLAPQDTREERGRGGDTLSLIRKWAKLGSEMRKGKNKD
ncbi:hypothetical protein FRC04_012179 [Tulasnella sp. 424]|nr:hypothetical protein FRC04_012179 [Tulasnella sp. 424]